MAESEKLIRTKSTGIRLDPKTHFLAKIAARYLAVNPGFKSQSLSSFTEWAIQYVLRPDVMKRIEIEMEATSGKPTGPKQPAPLWHETLWDENEANRFFNLATLHQDLLTDNEKNIWTLFTMHMDLNKRKISQKAFREFWNNPAINTSDLKGWND